MLSKIAEGGQTWAHRMRMLRQVIKSAVKFAALFGFFIFILLMSQVDKNIYQGAWYYAKSKTAGKILPKIEINNRFWSKSAREIFSQKNPLIDSRRVTFITQPYFYTFLDVSAKNFSVSILSSTFGMSLMMLFFFFRGIRKTKHLSGRKIIHPKILALQLKLKLQASKIRIGSLPLVKNTETQHILITGGTGSGKTNCIHKILEQIKTKSIVVDTTGVFVEKYYRKDKDFILNPFDQRSVPWNPWIECKTSFDFDEIAECFIPSSFHESENYWRIAARSLFSSVLKKTKESKRTSELEEWILSKPLADLATFVQNTKAAAHMDLKSEKTAGSVRSVASSFLSCLEFLQDTKEPFSILDWIKKEEDSKLFILSKPSHRNSIAPLLSCWISIAFKGLIQLDPDLKRRIWFILDEFPSLNKLKGIEIFLAEGRKYGGCGVLAIQSPSQIDSIYGHDVTKTIIGNCSTKIVFSEQDPIIAERISKSFGEREILEQQESISYGANSVRDGVSLTESRKREALVSSSEIQSLKKNRAFVKFPGNWPVTKIKLSIN